MNFYINKHLLFPGLGVVLPMQLPVAQALVQSLLASPPRPPPLPPLPQQALHL